MLSRAVLLSGQSKALVALGSKAFTTTSSKLITASNQEYKRPVRQEPGKVRFGFVPEEWFTFFYKKTGVTGPYAFGFTLSTYLLSKEIYVLEHEFYTGLSVLVTCVFVVKKLGPPVANYLDKERDEYEKSWNEGRDNEKKVLEESIENEKKAQWSAEGQTLLVQAKKENVDLQLEANYRNRLMTAFNEVKKRLDFQVEKENVERRMAHKNLVDWVVRRVRTSFTGEQEKQNIEKCITDLAVLAKSSGQVRAYA